MAEKKTNGGWLPIVTWIALFGLFITVAGVYSDLKADVRANTDGLQYTIKMLEQNLENLRQRLDRIEIKLDLLIKDSNDTMERGEK